jgi:hypothetical protein
MPRGRLSAGRPAARPVAEWNIDRLIATFSGIEPLIVAHSNFGFAPLTYSQVSHWRLRHTVPANRLAELFVVLHHVDGGVDLWNYIQQE